MPQSALLVEVPEIDDVVGPWRLRHDPVASRGIPAHVTALFPFVPPDALTDEHVARVRDVAASRQAFEFRLAVVDEFPGVIWLRPEPDEPFRDLTAALWRSFPQCPPYEGRYPDSQPHLTVALTTSDAVDHDALRSEIRSDLSGRLPVACRAESVSLFLSDDTLAWERRSAHRLLG